MSSNRGQLELPYRGLRGLPIKLQYEIPYSTEYLLSLYVPYSVDAGPPMGPSHTSLLVALACV